MEIARKLGRGLGEVKLVIGLYKGKMSVRFKYYLRGCGLGILVASLCIYCIVTCTRRSNVG
ncbi:MAG: hypothetical protein ACLTQF_12900 [Lachnospira sp.]